MVQHRTPLLRDPSGRDWAQSERFSNDCNPASTEARPGTTPVHSRILPIEHALRDCAGLPVKAFGLFMIGDDGIPRTFSSPSLNNEHQKIFSQRFREDFQKALRRTDPQSYGHEGFYDDLESDSRYGRKMSDSNASSVGSRRGHFRQQNFDSESEDERPVVKQRKRPRNEPPMLPAIERKTQSLEIGNSEEVEKFYYVRFKDMQQNACKIIGKAFVKLLEPKKQTHYPYTRGAEKAPPWWPKSGKNSVRHKEPDHLLKGERIQLLVHIVRMVVAPAGERFETVNKGGLTVKKLEEVTNEALANWFNDKEHPNNAKKKPYLREIFKVAKQEERYKDGGIDADSKVHVMYGDSKSGMADPGEDSEDEGLKYEDEDYDQGILTPVSVGVVSPAVLQAQHLQNREHENIFRTLPVRHYQQSDTPGTFMDNSSHYQQASFQQQSPTLQDPSPRTYTAPTFPTSQSTMFGGGWATPMVTNSPISNGYYATSPQGFSSASPQGFTSTLGQYQLPPPHSQGQNMLPLPSHDFSNLGHVSRPNYDMRPSISSAMRTASLSHPHQVPSHQMPSHSYEDYLHSDGVSYEQGHDHTVIKPDHMHQ